MGRIDPKTYLTHDEEEELVKFLIQCCKIGYGKTRGELLKIVEETRGRSLMAQYLKDGGVTFRKGGLNLVGRRSKVPVS